MDTTSVSIIALIVMVITYQHMYDCVEDVDAGSTRHYDKNDFRRQAPWLTEEGIFRGRLRKWLGGLHKNVHVQKIIYRCDHPKATASKNHRLTETDVLDVTSVSVNRFLVTGLWKSLFRCIQIYFITFPYKLEWRQILYQNCTSLLDLLLCSWQIFI